MQDLNAAGAARFTIDPNGLVGIGTTTPTQKLEVVGGNLKISTPGNGIIFPDSTTQFSAGAALNATSNTFTGNISAASYFGSGANLTGVNANMLNGLTSSAFAQVAASNMFTANQTINSSAGNALTVSSSDVNGTAGVFTNSAGGKILTLSTGTKDVFSADANGVNLKSIVVNIPNAPITGTVLNELAKFTSAGTATVTGAGETGVVVGVVVAGAGTSGNAVIAFMGGLVGCVFDNTPVVADFIQVSPTTAGLCHDAGATRPTAGSVLGVVVDTTKTPPMVFLFGGR